jgi:hypothetical protein
MIAGHLTAALTIIVRFSGEVAVDPPVLARAQVRVETILGWAGVTVAWRKCSDRRVTTDVCDSAAAANEAVVRFLTGPSPISVDACGVALVPRASDGHFISLFIECVRRAADGLGIPEDVVFGCSLAHEIGHLLLGTNSHGPIGLMQAQPRPIDWRRANRNALRFTPDEVRRIEEALKRRIALTAVTGTTRDSSGAIGRQESR